MHLYSLMVRKIEKKRDRKREKGDKREKWK
jgi:hypothetical protein